MRLKEIIKKIPILNSWAKSHYDQNRESTKMRRISAFLTQKLPYISNAPENFSVGHEPTIRCNLKCKMCYQAQTRRERQEELKSEEILKIYQRLEGKISEIKIVGGEPFVRHDILDLIKFWDERGVAVALQTNLTLVNPAMVQQLKHFNNIKAFLTSLDGPRQVHDSVRGVPGSYSRLTSAIETIHEQMPHAEVSIFGTMLLDDNFDTLFEVVDIVKGLGIGSVQFLFEQVNRPQDVAASQKTLKNKLGWLPETYRINTQVRDKLFENTDTEKIRKKLDEFRAHGIKKKCFVNFTPYNFYKNIGVYLGLRDKKIFCTKLLNPELRIVQSGDVVWCDIIEKSFGNLKEKTPEEIWLSKDYQDFREFLKTEGALPICRRCCKAAYIDPILWPKN